MSGFISNIIDRMVSFFGVSFMALFHVNPQEFHCTMDNFNSSGILTYCLFVAVSIKSISLLITRNLLQDMK